jgi:TorA maturation chaperone TorD
MIWGRLKTWPERVTEWLRMFSSKITDFATGSMYRKLQNLAFCSFFNLQEK